MIFLENLFKAGLINEQTKQLSPFEPLGFNKGSQVHTVIKNNINVVKIVVVKQGLSSPQGFSGRFSQLACW